MGEGVRLSTCTRQHTRIFCSSRGFTGRYRPRQETEKYPGEVASLHLSDNSHQASGYRSRMNLSPTSIITTFHYIPHASFHHAVIYNTLDNIPHYAGTIPHAAAIARFLAEHNPPALATGPHLADTPDIVLKMNRYDLQQDITDRHEAHASLRTCRSSSPAARLSGPRSFLT